jgi:TolA-binding protein
MVRKIFVLVLVVVMMAPLAMAQQSAWKEINQAYKAGMELYEKALYTSAAKQFEKVESIRVTSSLEEDERTELSLLKENARFYQAICALELGDFDAEERFLKYIKDFPASANAKAAYYQVGRSYFAKKNFDKAIEWFSKLDSRNLAGRENLEYRYKLGYSLFMKEQFGEAKPLFESLKEGNHSYSESSIYYYAYIAYMEADYKTALREFERLKGSKNYENSYPYYITALYYLDKRYDDVLSYALPILETTQQVNEMDMHRILGATYFAKNDLANAKKYYDLFQAVDQGKTQNNQDNYQIGYIAYKLNDYEKTIVELEKMQDPDAYYQSAMIILGDAYVKTGNKQAARNAFFKASKMDFDADLKEEGLFNYAKLSYELEFHQVGLEATQEYLDTYPQSKRQEEAKTLLAESLLSTRNYRAAVDILESISNRGPEANAAYQKVTYYRGLEFYNERAFENAISLFMRSEANPADQEILALATYWKAEAMYEVRKYAESVTNFNKFLQNPAARRTDVYSYANYALAYAAFRNNNFNTSASFFERFLSVGGNSLDANVRNDAIARLGDSYFSLRNYGRALQNYDRLLSAKASNQDYALFQRGMILGLQGDNQGKMATLRSVIERFPNSNYADDVSFEVPYTYFLMDEYDTAIAGLEKMVEDYPRSSYVPRALVTIGLVQYNKGDNDQALRTFERVVEQYSTTDEAKQAMRSIENIYLDQGNATGFINYATSTNIGNLTTAEQDNLAFQAAHTLFSRGDFAGAVLAVNAYFDKFPKPIQEKFARYIRGESLYRTGKPQEALHDFNIIINDWTSQYTEQSLLTVSKLYLSLGQYNDAIKHLKQLELTSDYKEHLGFAYTNLLNSYWEINDMDETIKYANLLKNYDRASEEELATAHLYAARAMLRKGEVAPAMKELNLAVLKSQTVIGAEARYRVGQLQYEAKEFDKAMETAFDVINNMSSHDYWVAKSFILLADVYAAKGDAFQAKSTLESVIENYEGEDDIIPSAKERLQKLNK